MIEKQRRFATTAPANQSKTRKRKQPQRFRVLASALVLGVTLTLPVAMRADTLSLPLSTGPSQKVDLGAFAGDTSVTVTATGNGDVVDSRWQVNPDGSLYAPASGSYSFANQGAAYSTTNGGDGVNHFPGGGANYDMTGSGYPFAGKQTTDTTDPGAIRIGALVGTFASSPTRADWFLIGSGGSFQVPSAGAHLFVAINDSYFPDNHGSYSLTFSGTAPSCVAPPAGITSSWQGEGNASDALSGNDGVIQGGFVFGPGVVGTGFKFEGTSQYIRIPSSDSLKPTGSFSIDAWIYPTADNSGTILSKWNDSIGRSYVLHMDASSSLNFSVADDNTQSNGSFQALKTPANSITLNAWNHVAGVYDQSTGTRSIYINGVLAASRTDTPYTVTTTNADVSIGTSLRGSNPQDFFQGSIDEVDFFNTALSGSDVQAIYNAGSTGKCQPPPIFFNAVHDFDIARNDTNQTWQYGFTAPDGTGFSRYSRNDGNINNGALLGWYAEATGLSVIVNVSGVTQHYNSSTDQDPGVLGMFPSQSGAKSVVRWTAPMAGSYRISGYFIGIDNATSDASVVGNGDTVHPLFFSYVNGKGTEQDFFITRDLNAGDTIDFRVGWGDDTLANYSYDGTGLSAFIGYLGAPSPTPSPTPSATPTATPTATATATPTATATATPTATATATPTATATLPPITAFTVSGPASDGGPITFNATTGSGVNARVQYSTDPNIKTDNNEGSWTDLLDGGAMKEDTTDPRQYSLVTTAYPGGSPIYFRAIASKDGYTDSITPPDMYRGPYSLVAGGSATATPSATPTASPTASATPSLQIAYFRAVGPASDGAPIDFSAAATAGARLRVQFTTDKDIETDHNESSWTDLLDSGVMHEQQQPNSSLDLYTLTSNAYPTGSGIFFRVIASKDGADVISDYRGPYTLHVKPGLSATLFTVNGSSTAGANLADTVLRFAAVQSRRPMGLGLRVQASTDDKKTWNDLANGGAMMYDAATGKFILNTNNYPQSNGVWFRAISSAKAFDDTISDPIGPFDLFSSKQHLNKPSLEVRTNTGVADWKFTAKMSGLPGGGSLRVQSSTTPADELSWKTIAANGGQMRTSKIADEYMLLADNLPSGAHVYFRVIASASGYIDSMSGICGDFNVQSVFPPAVAVIPPSDLSLGGDGTSPQNRMIFPTGVDLPFYVAAQTGGTLRSLELHINNFVAGARPDELAQKNFVDTLSQVQPGDYTLQAVAVDDQGVTGRGGTVLFIRVVPRSGRTALHASATKAAEDGTASRVYYVAHDGGLWTHPDTWVDQDGNNGVPTENDFVVVGANTVKVTFDEQSPTPYCHAGSLSLDGGKLVGFGQNLVIYKNLTLVSGQIEGGLILLAEGAVGNLVNTADIAFTYNPAFSTDRSDTGVLLISASATLDVHGSAGLVGMGKLLGDGNIHWNLPIGTPLDVDIDPNAGRRAIAARQTTLKGLNDGVATGGLLISNDGSGIVAQGGGNIVSTGGNNIVATAVDAIVAQGGGNIVAQGGGNIVAQGGGNIVAQGGGNIVAQGGGNIVAQGGGNFISHNGSAELGPKAKGEEAAAPIQIAGGDVNLSACTFEGDVQMDAGVLHGSGVILGSLTNNGGYIMPGSSGYAGAIGVSGNFVQGTGGSLVLENGGYFPSQYDQLQVGGTASLGGKLDLKTINGYTPGTQDVYVPLSFAAATGAFDQVSSNGTVSVNADGMIASVDASKPQPKPGQPLNISTRMEVLNGDNVLIAGFIVSGPAGTTKRVMIRGLGPSLAAAGVANPLSDPLLELHSPDGSVISNDNWSDASNTDTIPNGFAPSDPHEAVIVVDLPIGSSGYSNYTAILKGAHGETGVGLAEAYDLSSDSGQFANISTRGFVDTGDNVMIGGFIVGGSEPAKVLVRAIGPSLADAGVQGALTGTTLELHDSNGAVLSNQGWRSTQESEVIATTIPPTNDGDSAIVETLVPGNYTAVVRGANGATGVALVEAYNLQ